MNINGKKRIIFFTFNNILFEYGGKGVVFLFILSDGGCLW